jgi:hypothetical protein
MYKHVAHPIIKVKLGELLQISWGDINYMGNSSHDTKYLCILTCMYMRLYYSSRNEGAFFQLPQTASL